MFYRINNVVIYIYFFTFDTVHNKDFGLIIRDVRLAKFYE